MKKKGMRMKIPSDNTEKEIVIFFKKEFYRKESVLEAIEDFKEICDSELSEEKGGVKVLLKPKQRENRGCLGGEFSNYVLDLMKNQLIV